MIVVGRVILLGYQPWRWGDLNSRPAHVHVLARNPTVGHHGIIDYILGERVITDGGIMWQVTLMSLVLWSPPVNSNLQMILKVMLCHDILRSLLQLLDGLLVLSRVMCDGHVVRARLVDSM